MHISLVPRSAVLLIPVSIVGLQHSGEVGFVDGVSTRGAQHVSLEIIYLN